MMSYLSKIIQFMPIFLGQLSVMPSFTLKTDLSPSSGYNVVADDFLLLLQFFSYITF